MYIRTFSLQIVKPVCSSGLTWCPLTSACEAACQADLQNMLTRNWTCDTEAGKSFCSNEASCQDTLVCPTSFVGM